MISARGLSKAYKHYPSRWARLREWFVPHGAGDARRWVLRDVTFDVSAGEAVGILGVNGAGKSTLLRILAGTTRPTMGTVSIHGRVSALLELGLGFHPDFTGRENALLAGQLIGIPADELKARYREIEAFAEIGDYFDQPLRTYSSGMAVRLAFSVATLTRPDVLIVDEALSVGDAFFQVKSFARIKQYRADGTTILLVSHDVGTIKSVCDRAILLSGGRIERDGGAVAVADYYSAVINNRLHECHIVQDGPADLPVTRSGTREVEVVAVRLRGADGQERTLFRCGDPVCLEIELAVAVDVPKLVQGFLIRDRRGNDVYGTNTYHLDQVIPHPRAGSRFRLAFAFPANLGEDVYSVSVATVNSDVVLWRSFDWIENVARFRVVHGDEAYFVGCASLAASCTIEALEPEPAVPAGMA